MDRAGWIRWPDPAAAGTEPVQVERGRDLGLKLLLAPDRIAYLKRNWLAVVALLVPAMRSFRVVRVVRVHRAARAVQGLRLVRVLTSLNRGMKALGAAMSRRASGYVVLLTVVVTLVGSAGMPAFEGPALGGTPADGAVMARRSGGRR